MTYLATVGVAVFIAALIALYVLAGPHLWRPKLSKNASHVIREFWKQLQPIKDPHRKILDAASIFDRTLREAGFTGTLGEKWKRASVYAKDPEPAWKAVKLRNILAHEIGTKVSLEQAEKSFKDFREASELFLR